MIEFVFLDLDDTILDFHKAEHIALGKTFREFGLDPTQEVMDRYTAINHALWQALERKEMTREQVLVGRFSRLFSEYRIATDAEKVARRYEYHLSQGHYFMPDALESLQSLSKKYKLYLASNGTASVQAGRLKSANISGYFEKIFISQEIGANKPDKLYFDRCADQIPGYDPQKAVIAGDSLTSDVLGGIHAGIKTVWVNYRGYPASSEIRPDYAISNLKKLEGLLDTL